MTKYLPGCCYEISDNAECLRLLVEFGLSDKMQPQGKSNTTYVSVEMEHHYALMSYHKGHTREQDNGFVGLLLAKTNFNKEQAFEFFADLIGNTCDKINIVGPIVRNQEQQ